MQLDIGVWQDYFERIIGLNLAISLLCRTEKSNYSTLYLQDVSEFFYELFAVRNGPQSSRSLGSLEFAARLESAIFDGSRRKTIDSK